MKTILAFAAGATLAASLAASAADVSQLAASAGIDPAAAAQMSLTEIAAAKFNRDGDADDRQTVGSAAAPIEVDQIVTVSSRSPARQPAQLVAAAGLSPAEAQGLTLSQIAAVKFNRDTRPGDFQTTGF
jgi:hypothetical protein